jgi:hypothetical protein
MIKDEIINSLCFVMLCCFYYEGKASKKPYPFCDVPISGSSIAATNANTSARESAQLIYLGECLDFFYSKES